MALHIVDDVLLHEWMGWSARMEKFDEEECLKKWEIFGKRSAGMVTIGSLHYWAKGNDYKKEVERNHRLKLVPKGSKAGGVGGGRWKSQLGD